MTRDEAICKTKAAMYHSDGVIWCSNLNEAIAKIERNAVRFVDAAVALGMLKIDEPQTVDTRITESLRISLGVFLSSSERERLKDQLSARGLRIVEIGKR